MSNFANPATWLIDWLSNRFGSTNGKVSATERSICGIPAVLYAVEKYRSLFGQLPFYPMRRKKWEFSEHEGAERASDHQFYNCCKDEANRQQTAIVFREMLITQAMLWGNGRAAIAGTPANPELLPMHADRSDTFIVDGEKWHATMPDIDDRILQQIATAETDQQAKSILQHEMIGNVEKVVVLHDSEVLHLPGFSWDGCKGISIAAIMRETFESNLHQQRHSRKNWEKGFLGSMMISAPKEGGFYRDEKQARDWLANFKKEMSGSDGEKIGLLTHGLTAEVLTMSGRDAQWVEQMRIQREDVALIFSLEGILGTGNSISYNSEEMKQLAFLINGLARWLVKWEQECNRKLRRKSEKQSVFFKHNVSAILRTDQQTQASIISTYVTARIYSPNFVLTQILDLPPYPGGDEVGNPAIDVKQPPDQQTPAEPAKIEGPPANDGNQQARAVVLNQVKHLQGVEAKRVIAGAGKKNYLDWLDEFYSSWVGTVVSAIGNTDFAIEYCNESKRLLIEASGRATPETFVRILQEETEAWGNRAEKLTDMILGIN